MPTHRVNDSDFLQQVLPLHSPNPSPLHHQKKQLISLSKPLVGRNLLKGDMKSGVGFFPSASTHFGKSTKLKVSCWERNMQMCISNKFILINSWIHNILRKAGCLEAESSYYALELLHSHWQQKDIFLDWISGVICESWKLKSYR